MFSRIWKLIICPKGGVLVKFVLMRNKLIGVFDSGFGGLEILREIVKTLPEYDYLYLGDTARTPYGTRSQEIIYKFTKQAVDFLFKRRCQLIILACNTASSEALRRIQQDYLPKHYPTRKVLGVIIPACEKTITETGNNRVGVLGTEGTIASGAFKRELKKLNSKVKVFQKACPLLVPIVEEGEQDPRIVTLVIKKYLTPLLKKNIDSLILGCTHYGILEDKIKEITGLKIKIIAEGKVVAEKFKNYLKRHPELEEKLSKNCQVKFLTTDETAKFKILGSKFFGKTIRPYKVNLE